MRNSNTTVKLATSDVYASIPAGYTPRVPIGKNIRALRRKADISQTDLGKVVGVKQGAVSKWESDESEPDASDLPALALALNVSLDDLMQGVDAQYDKARDLSDHATKVKRPPHNQGESDAQTDGDDREVRELREQVEGYKRLLGQVENAASTLASVIAAGNKIGTAGATESKTRRRHRKTG